MVNIPTRSMMLVKGENGVVKQSQYCFGHRHADNTFCTFLLQLDPFHSYGQVITSVEEDGSIKF